MHVILLEPPQVPEECLGSAVVHEVPPPRCSSSSSDYLPSASLPAESQLQNPSTCLMRPALSIPATAAPSTSRSTVGQVVLYFPRLSRARDNVPSTTLTILPSPPSFPSSHLSGTPAVPCVSQRHSRPWRVPVLATALGACAASPAPPPLPPHLQLPLFVLVVSPARMLTLQVSTQVYFPVASQHPDCFLLGTLLYPTCSLVDGRPLSTQCQLPTDSGFHCFVPCTGPGIE